MPGIDPPRLARLQEIPVCEKCCGLEHLFLFHSGMKPRLSGRREERGEKKKNDLFFFLVVVVEEEQPPCGTDAHSVWLGSPLLTASHLQPVLL